MSKPVTFNTAFICPLLFFLGFFFVAPDFPQSVASDPDFAKKVAAKITANVPCKRVGIAVIGLEVPHAHIHLVPLNAIGDINFSNPRLELSADEMAEIQQQIIK